jgi:glutaredoxin
MQKSNKIWIILGAAAVLIILLTSGKWANKPKMIYFYGDTCPHCHDVLDYIAAEGIRDKLSFRELETYNNRNNAQLLVAKAKLCKMSTAQGVPVPFFFDGENCYIGSDKIIEVLNKQIAENENNVELNAELNDDGNTYLENNEIENLNLENSDEINFDYSENEEISDLE